MTREEDIQELCRQVLEETFVAMDWNRGEGSCPWCGGTSWARDFVNIEDIKHIGNCAYLIAKDLSTNITTVDNRTKK